MLGKQLDTEKLILVLLTNAVISGPGPAHVDGTEQQS